LPLKLFENSHADLYLFPETNSGSVYVAHWGQMSASGFDLGGVPMFSRSTISGLDDACASQFSFALGEEQYPGFIPSMDQVLNGSTLPSDLVGENLNWDGKRSNDLPLWSGGWRQSHSNGLAHRSNICSNEDAYHLPGGQQADPHSFLCDTGSDMTNPIAPEPPPDAVRAEQKRAEATALSSGVVTSDIQLIPSVDPRYSRLPQFRRRKGFRVEKAQHRPSPMARASGISSLDHSQPMSSVAPPQQSPDNMNVAVYSLWLLKNRNTMPSERTLLGLSVSFGDSIEIIRKWFLRNVAIAREDEDTGYQTMSTSGIDVTSSYRRNRRECNRKAGNVSLECMHSSHFERDEARPYACTSRCGAKFREKAAWKRHEEINRPPKVWICSFRACHKNPDAKRTFFREDHFRKHLSKDHANLETRKRHIAACCLPIKSNFSKYCIFRGCDEKFKSWKVRIDHIADHLKRPWNMSQWNNSEDDIGSIEGLDADASDSSGSESDTTAGEDDSDDSDDSPEIGPLSFSAKDQPSANDRNHQKQWSGPQEGQRSYDQNGDGASRGFSSYGYGYSSFGGGGPLTSHASSSKSSYSLMDVMSLSRLGSGSMAIVDEVRVNGNEWTSARKRICHNRLGRGRGSNREATIMKRLRHPHIARIVASYMEAESMTLIMQPVADYNLLQYLNACSAGQPVKDETRDWFNCLSSGLQYLHHVGVRHRDIKPSNILIKNKAVIYTDFGSSNLVGDDDSISSDSGDFTVQYAAPEVHRGERGRAADVFALGCVFFEIVSTLSEHSSGNWSATPSEESCRKPVSKYDSDTVTEMIQQLRISARQPQMVKDQSIILDNCEAMMRRRPDQRPTAADIVAQIPPRPCCVEVSDDMSVDSNDGDNSVEFQREANTSNTDKSGIDDVPDLVSSNDDCTSNGLRSVDELLTDDGLSMKDNVSVLSSDDACAQRQTQGPKVERPPPKQSVSK